MNNKNRQREDKKRGEEEEEINPYVRDKALNGANNKRFGEKIRPDPYILLLIMATQMIILNGNYKGIQNLFYLL
jgi:hypothetical protein